MTRSSLSAIPDLVASADRTMSGLPVAAGIDLGSTGVKILIVRGASEELLQEQVATPWRAGPGGTTELDAIALTAAVDSLLQSAAGRLAAMGVRTVDAISVAGMGETGMLVDETLRPPHPGFAWFDPRGQDEAEAFPREVRDQFAGRTGLPLGAQVTVAKLAHLRRRGTRLGAYRWLDLPEFVVASLGGDVALEYSLASRTGLLDQDTDRPWPAMLDLLGVEEAFMPELRDAGASWGTAREDLPGAFAGAALTVAGHDHLVAAEAGGSLNGDQYHVSIGTAEVLLRVSDVALGYEARSRLAGHLINEVRHVVPGKRVIVAGVKTGLLLRRALQAAGIHTRAGRDALDRAVMALPLEGQLVSDGIEVSGARNDDGVLRLTFRTDGISPAEVFAAVLRHSNDEIQLLIDAIDRELPPAVSTTLTGGWAGMQSVQRARGQVLPGLSVTQREQETAFGAALVGLRLLSSCHEAKTNH